MRYPTVNTKLAILLGNPLGHSVSPPMHNCVFEKLGLDWMYMPVEVSPENLESVFMGLRKMNVGGLNVTIPHKIHIMDFLDDLDPLAATIGAVNTICMKDGKAKGYNTDGEGFILSLEEETGLSTQDKRFFLLGSGGAARAISMTLAYRGASKIYISNRTAAKAEALVNEINNKISNCAEIIPDDFKARKTALADCNFLVNCTNLGMHPMEDVMPIDESLIENHLVVVDIIYNPLTTKLLREAENKGCKIAHGLGMLIYQGAAAFKIWTGADPLIEEMTSTVYSLMQKRT